MRSRMVVGWLLFSAGAVLAADYVGSDWPQWLGPNRDSTSPEVGWVAKWVGEPEVLWRKKIGTGFGAVAVAEGRAYVVGNTNKPDQGGYHDTIYCLNADTGETVWEHSYPCRVVNRLHEGGPSSTPTVHAGRVYTLSKVGQAFCLDAVSGKVIWEADLAKLLGLQTPEWGFTSSPVIEGDRVVFQAGATVALDAKDGKVSWTSPARPLAYSSPAPFELGGKRMLAVLSTDGLGIIDAADGKEWGFTEWETEYRTNSTTPLVIGDKVFVSTGYNKGCGLFQVGSTGALSSVYRNDSAGQTMSNHFQNAVAVGGHLYGFDGNSHIARNIELVCMEFATGKVLWRQKGFGAGSLIAADGKLIVLSDDGRLATVEASTEGFKPISEAQVMGGRCWTMPTLSHGRVYCRNARGDMVCVDVRPE